MKRIRRISIEIEHREVTVSLAQMAEAPSVARPAQASGETAEPGCCPDCGAAWITIVAQTDVGGCANADRIRRALQQSGLHLHVSRAGELKICHRSFEEIKETF